MISSAAKALNQRAKHVNSTASSEPPLSASAESGKINFKAINVAEKEKIMCIKNISKLSIVMSIGAILTLPTISSTSAFATPQPVSVQPAHSLTQPEGWLDVIHDQTDGGVKTFSVQPAVNAGVDHDFALEYAGVLKAAGEPCAAPASDTGQIEAMVIRFAPSADQIKASSNFDPMSIDWGKALRVAGSYMEYVAIRSTLPSWYPVTGCIPNPDGNGTWLVIILP